MTNTVGFVGLGIMGVGMVKNLVTKLGLNLVVWNRGAGIAEEMSLKYPGKVKQLQISMYLLVHPHRHIFFR